MNEITEEQARKQLEKEAKKVNEQEDLEKVLSKEEKLKKKIRKNQSVSEYAGKIKIMFSLIRDYSNGNYRSLPWKTIAAVAGAIIYAINPFDIIPDFIPMIGMVDDAAVIAACLRLVNDDLQEYVRWKASIPQRNPGTELS